MGTFFPNRKHNFHKNRATSIALYVNACRKKGVVLKRKVAAGFDLLGGVLEQPLD